MLPIRVEISWRKSRVLLQVSLLMAAASLNSAMQLGTVKYSGSAIRVGCCLAAFRIWVLAADKLSSRLGRMAMWSTLTFTFVPLVVLLLWWRVF